MCAVTDNADSGGFAGGGVQCVERGLLVVAPCSKVEDAGLVVKLHALEIPPGSEGDACHSDLAALTIALVDLEQNAAVGQCIHLAASINGDGLAVIGQIAGERGLTVFQVHGADGRHAINVFAIGDEVHRVGGVVIGHIARTGHVS